MSKKTSERYSLKNRYFDYLKETAVFVDPYIDKFINEKFKSLPELKEKLLARYRFGKPQLRPALVRLSFELFGGKDWKKIIPICASVEVRDTGYYCYDDILDLNVNSYELMLLAGTFLSVSNAMISEIDESFEKKILKKLYDEIFELDFHNVQAAFLELDNKRMDEKIYLRKVVGFNFWESAFRMGCIMTGGSQEDIRKAGDIGKNIGMAYIIANDTWDFGKNLEDFQSGKSSLPMIYVFNKKEDNHTRELKNLFGKKLSPSEVDLVRLAIVKSGAIDYGKRKAEAFCRKASKILETFPQSFSRELIEFSMTMTQRNKYFEALEK